MKSNAKQVMDKAKAFLIECIMSPNFEEMGAKSDSLRDRLLNIVDWFRYWESPYEIKHNPNNQDRFIYWMQGLPSVLPVDFYGYDIDQRLTEWGLPNDKGYDRDQSHRLYHHILYSELTKLFTKNGIEL